MNKLRELARLQRLERLATAPGSVARGAMFKGFAIAAVGGVALSIADHIAGLNQADSLKWIYFVVGVVAGLGGQFIAIAMGAEFSSPYVDLGAVQRRMRVLQGEAGADV